MEYKFRGKRVDNGEWVYGDKLTVGNKIIIVPVGAVINFNAEYNTCDGKPYGFGEVLQGECNGRWPVEVHPDSVGMWTGLEVYPCNTEVYQGDQISCNSKEMIEERTVGIVEWDDVHLCWAIRHDYTKNLIRLYDVGLIKVIGNTTDNKALALVDGRQND